MLITCPSCGASYDVPDALVRDGRTVRCSRCRRQWSVTTHPDRAGAPPPPGPAPARPAPLLSPLEAFGFADEDDGPPPPQHVRPRPAEPDFEFDPDHPPRPLQETRPAYEPADARPSAVENPEDGDDRTTRILVGLGWLGTILVLAVLVWAGYHFRASIVQAWPASERLYAALGWRVAP